jgi:hypothetical protein
MCFLARNVSTYRGCDTAVILQYWTNPDTDNLQLPPSKVQHDSTSSSIPLEHSSAWQREIPLYTRDGRVKRLDRNASVIRDWSAEQAAAMLVNHKAVGLSSTNGNGLGHWSKHRVQGNCFSSEMFQVVETQVFLLCRQNGEASFLHALFCVVKFGSTM